MSRFLLVLLLCLLAGGVSPVSAETLLARVRATLGTEIYQADVVERVEAFADTEGPSTAPQGGKMHFEFWPVDVLTIRCIDGCQKPVSFSEQVDGGLIGLYRLREDSRDFVSMWGGGSSSWVRIYHVGDGKITKVMEEGSRFAPEFTYKPDGSLRIRLGDAYSPPFYVDWDGRKYRASTNER